MAAVTICSDFGAPKSKREWGAGVSRGEGRDWGHRRRAEVVDNPETPT